MDVTQFHYSEVDRLTVSTAARVLNSDCTQRCDHRPVSNCKASAGGGLVLSGGSRALRGTSPLALSPVTCPPDTRAPRGHPNLSGLSEGSSSDFLLAQFFKRVINPVILKIKGLLIDRKRKCLWGMALTTTLKP